MARRSGVPKLLVILTSIAFGVAASLGYVGVASQGIERPPQVPGMPWKASPAENLMIFEACIVFYSVVYLYGRARSSTASWEH